VSALAHRQLVIVGGGAAGSAAALEARRLGLETCLLDDPAPPPAPSSPEAPPAPALARWHASGLDVVGASGAEVRPSATVWGIWDHVLAAVEPTGEALTLDADYVVLATGSQDRAVVFPGWTLPGVLSASQGWAWCSTPTRVQGRRVLVAGAGPEVVLLAAAFVRAGARRVLALDAVGHLQLDRARGAVLPDTERARVVARWLRARATLARAHVRLRRATLIQRVDGADRVEQAQVAQVDDRWRALPGTEQTVGVDLVCLCFGSEPELGLSRLAGCRAVYDVGRAAHVPWHDVWMRTSVPHVSVAGGHSAWPGHERCVDEGQLAAVGIALRAGRVSEEEAERRAARPRRRLRALAEAERGFGARIEPGLDELACGDTVVCPCEGVRRGQLEAVADAGDLHTIRALTRAGMGICQGRACQRQTAVILARAVGVTPAELDPPTARPPVRPVLLGAIAERELAVSAEPGHR
jgi:thioredoxin reductase